MDKKLTFLYRCLSVSTLSVSAPRAGVPLFDDLHVITVRVIRSSLFSLPLLLFPIRKEEWWISGSNRWKREGQLNEVISVPVYNKDKCCQTNLILLFYLFILRGQTHGGLFCFWCDELIHTVFVKEPLQESTLAWVSTERWYRSTKHWVLDRGQQKWCIRENFCRSADTCVIPPWCMTCQHYVSIVFPQCVWFVLMYSQFFS